MEKLSKEDVKFIDTYLKNSEVLFTDIRIEMVDHVASEIESVINDGDQREFYYIFKDYMLKNKASLLKDNRKYYKASDKKILRAFSKKVFSLKGLALFFLILSSFNFINEFADSYASFSLIRNAPIFVIFCVGVFYIFLCRKNKERYSSLERIAFYFMIIYQVINVFKMSNKDLGKEIIVGLTWLEMVSAIFILTVIILFLTAIELKKEYELKYR